jgi:hypothetical protein
MSQGPAPPIISNLPFLNIFPLRSQLLQSQNTKLQQLVLGLCSHEAPHFALFRPNSLPAHPHLHLDSAFDISRTLSSSLSLPPRSLLSPITTASFTLPHNINSISFIWMVPLRLVRAIRLKARGSSRSEPSLLFQTLSPTTSI